MDKSPQCVDVLIVGGGWMGTGVAASLNSSGVTSFVIIEQGDVLGSFWKHNYQTLTLHTGNHELWNSPSHLCNYPFFKSKDQASEYLNKYGEHHKIMDRVRFHEKVIKIQFTGSIDKDSENLDYLWTITTTKSVFKARIVCVATSVLRVPHVPQLPNQHLFKGTLIHSSQFTSGKDFKNKKVLVVGSGNSAAEQGLDLYEGGATVHMLIRSPRHFVPIHKVKWLQKISYWIGKMGNQAFYQHFKYTAHDKEWHDLLRDNDKFFAKVSEDLSQWGIKKPSIGVNADTFYRRHSSTIDWGLSPLIKKGKVQVVASGIKNFSETGVEFEDGTHNDYDAVILATGYLPGLEEFLGNHEKFLTTTRSASYPPEFRTWPFPFPNIDGRGQSRVVSTLYFPGFDYGAVGGLMMGIFSWYAGENIAVQLGKMTPEQRTIKPGGKMEHKGGNNKVIVAALLGLLVAVLWMFVL